MSRHPHWLLSDPELLEAVKRLAAEYRPTFRPDDILAHNQDPVVAQLAYRWGTPGTETGHGWEAAENTALTLEGDGGGDYPIFLRIELENSVTNADQNLTKTYKLQVKLNTGSWADLTAATSYARTLADSNIVDGAATTDRLTTSTDTFLAGEYDEGDGVCDALTWAAQRDHTDLLFSIVIRDADLVDGDVLEFRIVESDGTLIQAYTRTPSLTWNAAVITGTPDALTGGSTLATPSGSIIHGGTPADLAAASVLATPAGTVNHVGTPTDLAAASTLAQPTGALTWSGTPDALTVGSTLAQPTGTTQVGGTPDALTVGSSLGVPTGVLGIVSPLVRLVDSPNVPDGGVATTAQLTAPAGKTGGDFQASQLQDDHTELPAPTVAGEKYTEAAWVVELVDGQALPSDVIEFALMRDDGTVLALDVTPTATVEAGATVGTPAGLTVASLLDTPAGSVVHVGGPVGLTGASTLDQPSGSFIPVGIPDALSVAATLETPSGAVDHVGTPAELAVAALLEVAGGTTNTVGTPADLSVAAVLATPSGFLTTTGTPADLAVAATLEAPAGSVVHVGTPVELAAGSTLAAPVGIVWVLGTPDALTAGSALDTPTGAVPAVLEAFRFFNDDGAEAASTAAAAEDAALIHPTNTPVRLRYQVNALEDGERLRIVTRKQGTSPWKVVV